MDPLLERARTRLGRVLKGKWTLEDVLGVGGMAAVYRAVHRNGAAVAIKMLHPELAMDHGLRDRFLREGYVANKVGHDGTVKVLDDDVDDTDGAAFLVMELLEGETVEKRFLRKGERLPMPEVLSIAYHAADVLCAAHENGIVHRDIKPENLFLTLAGVLKILDFGVARLLERTHSDAPTSTQQGASLGTPAFMPPEQARGRWNAVDGRSDVWSLGATMFTLISGQWVHEMETTAEQIIAAATRPSRSLRDVAHDAPDYVVALVDRAIAFDMADRYQTMEDFRSAVQDAAARLSRASKPPKVSFAAAALRAGWPTTAPASRPSAEAADGGQAELESVPPSSGSDDLETRVLTSPYKTNVAEAASGQTLPPRDNAAVELEPTVEAESQSHLKLPSVESSPHASPQPIGMAPTTGIAIMSAVRPRPRRSKAPIVFAVVVAIASIVIAAAIVLSALRRQQPATPSVEARAAAALPTAGVETPRTTTREEPAPRATAPASVDTAAPALAASASAPAPGSSPSHGSYRHKRNKSSGDPGSDVPF